MFCGIFTQSFDAFWGHSNILKINCKAVSTTASSIAQNLCYIFIVPDDQNLKFLLKNNAFLWLEWNYIA